MLMSAYQTMPVIAVRERINGITLSVIDKATHLLSLTATSSWLITFTGRLHCQLLGIIRSSIICYA